jgi:mitogen-activated protein kinase kinase kinase
MPEEQRSYTVDVANCAGGVEVMEKVLKKADKVGSARRNDVMSRVETDDGGLSVDGWSVYLEWDETNDSGLIHFSFKVSTSDIYGQANHSQRQNS